MQRIPVEDIQYSLRRTCFQPRGWFRLLYFCFDTIPFEGYPPHPYWRCPDFCPARANCAPVEAEIETVGVNEAAVCTLRETALITKLLARIDTITKI